MILSDRTIREELAAGRIVIEGLQAGAIQPSSVDLHVDRYFRVFRNHTMRVIDVKEDQENLTELVEMREDEAFILHPGEFVLGSTAERVRLPDDLVARLEGKSSLGRLGLLIHSSLPGNERVMILDDSGLRLRRIEDVVRKRTQGKVVGFDPDTLEVGYHEITGWYEGPPDRIYEVQLASGRSVRVTAGHNLFTLDRDGEVRKLRTAEVRPGCHVAIAGAVPDPVCGAPTIDVLALAPEDAYPELVIQGTSVDRAFVEHPTEVVDLLRRRGLKHVNFYRSRRRLPLEILRQLPPPLDRPGPGDLLSVNGCRHALPLSFTVNANLAWLIGLYVAEGCRRRGQVTISNTEPEILDRAEMVLVGLGVPVHRTPHGVTAMSVLLSHVVDWLDAGSGARQKQIPDLVFAWPDHLLAAVLEGFVDGDGSRETTRTSLWSSSGRLVDDLLYLLARLGRRASAVDGGLLWDRVVEVRDTGEAETIFDLEVRPGGRKIENFLAGTGGVFVSNTAGFVDAGFDGHLTLELSNVANLPITLYPGMKIGQISFLRMTTPAETPYGSKAAGSKYQGQRGPTPSRYSENFRPSS